uniref:Uncharacterized protein n=1 Tax=Meloidogyne hapla TaxID=6305 RepID=A0A1I8AXC8_MELHA
MPFNHQNAKNFRANRTFKKIEKDLRNKKQTEAATEGRWPEQLEEHQQNINNEDNQSQQQSVHLNSPASILFLEQQQQESCSQNLTDNFNNQQKENTPIPSTSNISKFASPKATSTTGLDTYQQKTTNKKNIYAFFVSIHLM